MNLVIDIGNTLQKYAVFNVNDQEVYFETHESVTLDYLEQIFIKYKIEKSIYCSVSKTDHEVLKYLQNHSQCVVFNHQVKLPITIEYENIETLGLDRIANGVGAATCFPGENCLSIQAGSCIVYDFIDKNGIFQGGAISPGLQMRLKSLNSQTEKLPLLELDTINYFLGKNTQQSIKSGVINGVIFEIDGQIDAYKSQFEPINIVLTGGDMIFLQNSIKNQIFAIPNLVLLGLNKILKLNV